MQRNRRTRGGAHRKHNKGMKQATKIKMTLPHGSSDGNYRQITRRQEKGPIGQKRKNRQTQKIEKHTKKTQEQMQKGIPTKKNKDERRQTPEIGKNQTTIRITKQSSKSTR